MSSRTLGSLKEMDIITQDAYKVGQIVDIRYDPASWKVQFIKARTEKNASKMLSMGSGKSMVSLTPGDFLINDVVLIDENMDELSATVSADRDNAPTLSFMEGKKVVSREGVAIGIVQDVNVDVDLWTILSVSVRLDKGAFEPLGLKKGLLSKTVIVVRSEYIEATSDIITLNQSVTDMREEIIIE